jgi:hypothetical protein
MKHLNLLLASLCFGALTQAIAAEPPVAPAPQSTDAVAAATAAAASADSAKNAADAAAAEADKAKVAADAAAKEAEASKAEAEKKVMHARGYKQVMQKGQVMYCRRETMLGSNFDREVCNSFDNIQLQEKYAQDAVRQMHGGAASTPGK